MEGVANGAAQATQEVKHSTRSILQAVEKLYQGGGVRAFWVGNGLNTAKILPESAIKFMSYETSVRPLPASIEM